MRRFSPIYLASGSPRRRELLGQLGVPFDSLCVDVPELVRSGETPEELVLRLAVDKARAGLVHSRAQALPPRPVLGADTAVVVDGEILGKPDSSADGAAMLARIAGTSHQVYSGIALLDQQHQQTALSVSRVFFRPMTDKDVEDYLATGEGLDKAGCYAVQGLAAEFIERIDGSYSGIMGLPLFETAKLLHSAAR